MDVGQRPRRFWRSDTAITGKRDDRRNSGTVTEKETRGSRFSALNNEEVTVFESAVSFEKEPSSYLSNQKSFSRASKKETVQKNIVRLKGNGPHKKENIRPLKATIGKPTLDKDKGLEKDQEGMAHLLQVKDKKGFHLDGHLSMDMDVKGEAGKAVSVLSNEEKRFVLNPISKVQWGDQSEETGMFNTSLASDDPIDPGAIREEGFNLTSNPLSNLGVDEHMVELVEEGSLDTSY